MNVKIFSTVYVLVFLTFTQVFAADVPMGCLPKENLQALLKENDQSFLEQFMRETPNGKAKTSVTSLYANGGYVDNGAGYVVESKGTEACIIAKTRLNSGPGKDEVTVATIHEYAGQTLTAADFKKVANNVLNNEKSTKAEWLQKGISEKRADEWLWAFKTIRDEKGMPFEFSMKVVYRLSPNKTFVVSRSDY